MILFIEGGSEMTNYRYEDEILVSICCITYNQDKYIEYTLKSFLEQETNFKYEILIHDDASTDRTVEIIKKYEVKYPDIVKPIYQVENQYSKGKKINFVYNFIRARGKYIALCEGDDFWTDKKKLQRQVEYMEDNLKCSLCMHSTIKVNSSNECVGKFDDLNKDYKANIEDIILQKASGHYSSMLFRTVYVKQMPEFYFDSPVGDYPLKIYLGTKGYVYIISELMSAYRINVGITSKKVSKYAVSNNNKKMIKMLTKFDKYANYKYSKEIKQEILRRNFITGINTGEINYKLAKSNFKELYEKLDSTNKYKLQVEYFCPQFIKLAKQLNKVVQKIYILANKITRKVKINNEK